MANNFYSKDDNQEEAPLKVKVGDKEYDQDELSKLVGLGELATELETKWNTPLNRVVPEFTKKSQRLAELEPEFNELKKQQEETKKLQEAQRQAENQNLTVDQREAAKKAIVDILGYEPMDKGQFDQLYAVRRQGEEILSKTRSVLEDATKLGKPTTDVEKLLGHMSETGIKDPQKAYKDMFETELDKWKEDQLKSIKPKGFTSQGFSSAGSKTPEPVKVTRNNISQLLGEIVNRE